MTKPTPIKLKPLHPTIRDCFAMYALTAIIMRPGAIDYDLDTRTAYKYADAMIKAREA